MLNKVKDFFEMEYNDARVACGYKWTTPKKVVDNTIQRCLGVALFVKNTSDVSHDKIDRLYRKYRNKLEELENV